MATTGRPEIDDGERDVSTSGADGPIESDTSGGVRARLAIRDPPGCAVADVVADGATATDVQWADASAGTVEQFRARRGLEAEPIFAADEESVYRLADADADRDCPCRWIESLGYPIADVSVTGQPSQLVVTLLLPSPEPIVEIVDALESRGVSVRLECLVRSIPHDDESIVVDAGRLTDRQREVLEVAYRMGYFSYPREGNATAVAEELGIVRSTFTEHLAAAQRRLFEGIFDER
ncbi:helix-turn-helix domain-containing protein [Natrarchaeobaculum sulfurireducens]|uniref:Bacterio-opsin activator domain-containing protein n=1 Tax=Natrarchaeobaculum sulfurireducens TaxID=2044521 RepID=A0A346PM52_9EURY|nr:helix-turn-helix domain-containing protein [Natrarchaeobaculum sulfurireducens]AXR80597.1 Bacterio-opsin activator domain-containing protein [Natrarchaeobaculum sulfurireducens]